MPEDFLRIAATIAPAGTTSVPRGVRRAPWPAVAIETGDPIARVPEIAAALAATVGSVAVVAPGPEHDALAASGADLRDAEAAGRLSGGIDLLGLAAVKGLEFDAVVVVEPARILAERPDGGPGGLYTALTRSTRALAIVHAEPLPAALAAAPDLRHIAPAGVSGWLSGR